MIKCENCEYFWPDVDENGNTKDYSRCHFDGPDAWSPCAQEQEEYNYNNSEREG